MTESTKCPVCGCSINLHGWSFPGRFECTVHKECRESPDDIAKALLTAEPTAEEAARAARALWNSSLGLGRTIVVCEQIALRVLRAARGENHRANWPMRGETDVSPE